LAALSKYVENYQNSIRLPTKLQFLTSGLLGSADSCSTISGYDLVM